jgi:hypothetical protein
MRIHTIAFATLAAAFALAQAPAHAVLVTDSAAIPVPQSVITFNGYNNVSTVGPINVGAEVGDIVTFQSSPFATLGASSRNLGNNGSWGAGARFVASDFIAPRGTLTFRFDTAVSSIGALFNQFQTTSTNTLTLTAFGANGLALETHSYSIDTLASSVNQGQFLGIQRSAADIFSFGISDGTFVLDNLAYSRALPVSAIPEPTTWALILGGLGAITVRRRTRMA